MGFGEDWVDRDFIRWKKQTMYHKLRMQNWKRAIAVINWFFIVIVFDWISYWFCELFKLNNITIFKRCIEDCLIITTEDKITRIMDDLNNFQIKLKVTLEPKSEIQINYLDITVIREKIQLKLKFSGKTWTLRQYWIIIPYIISNKKKPIAINYIDQAKQRSKNWHRQNIEQL